MLGRAVDLERQLEEMERGRAEQRHLLTQVTLAQEQERQRIALDIHDDSVQVMTTAAVRLGILRSRLGDGELGELTAEVETIVRGAVQRLRHLMFELIPPALDREGLTAALALYLNRLQKESGVTFRLESQLEGQPPAEARAILYRIAQEAVTNVVKHARATSVMVSMDHLDGGYIVRVGDDGVGFSMDDVESRLPLHLGLTAMRQRAEMAGGWCRISSQAGSGTSVEAWVPGPPIIVLGEPEQEHRSTSA
jgi:signal transduction histidine kinase